MQASRSKWTTSYRLDEDYCNRSRLYNTESLRPRRIEYSKLESLPTEILETIFLGSANGNILLAAPRIAVQLSGNETLYRAAFTLAFYNHNLREVLNALQLSSLLPNRELPLDIWDMRSVTKAILRSRWCTYGWVRTLVNILTRHKIATSSSRNGEHTRSLECERCVWLEDETCFLQCKLWSISYGLGREILESSTDSPLKSVFENSLIRTDCPRSRPTCHAPRGDMWPPFESLNSECDERWDSREKSSEWLSAWMAADFVQYPEDHPFKVSPSAYRRAAICDLYENPLVGGWTFNGFESYTLLYVAHLFYLDPYSLPRTDPILLRWAAWTKRDLENYKKMWEGSYWQGLPYPIANDLNSQRERDHRVQSTFLYQAHLDVLHYVKTGKPRSALKACDFDMTGTLDPCRDPEALQPHKPGALPWSDECLILHGAKPPASEDLSFLSPDDFADLSYGESDLDGCDYTRADEGHRLWYEQQKFQIETQQSILSH